MKRMQYIYIYTEFYAQRLWLNTEITSEPFWTQKRTPHLETHPYTYLVGYHWRLDCANKPPTAKQIGLNRCSFGGANKNATYILRLWTKQWSPIYHCTYLVGPHCVAAWKTDQVSHSVSQGLALQEVVETLFKVFSMCHPTNVQKVGTNTFSLLKT